MQLLRRMPRPSMATAATEGEFQQKCPFQLPVKLAVLVK
jgi:hypothetical protein